MSKTSVSVNHDAPGDSDIDGIFSDGFDVIMELTKEEKKELIKMWRDYYDKTVENANCNSGY